MYINEKFISQQPPAIHVAVSKLAFKIGVELKDYCAYICSLAVFTCLIWGKKHIEDVLTTLAL